MGEDVPIQDGRVAYATADSLLASCGVRTGCTQLLASGATLLPRSEWDTLASDALIIQSYFNTCLALFKEMLAAPESAPACVQAALGDAPAHIGLSYHQTLSDPLLTTPLFYRTDESRLGHVLEVQTPGSLWGDHVLVADVLQRLESFDRATPGADLASGFARAAVGLCEGEARIHHLTDNASAPHSMRYFIDRTSRFDGISYYGVDPGIGPRDCNLVRSHSVYGLVAENFFHYRREKAERGEMRYDLPPHLLFDQKVCLAWPFEAETRARFDDSVRDLFAFTSLVGDGFVSLPEEEGGRISIPEFAARPRRDRDYFLKYAGTDVALNWGSQAVYSLGRLGVEKCEEQLRAASTDTMNGRTWTIQKADEQSETVSFWNHDGTLETATLAGKYSRFYGDGCLLGSIVQHRGFYKVHGQVDTVVGVIASAQ